MRLCMFISVIFHYAKKKQQQSQPRIHMLFCVHVRSLSLAPCVVMFSFKKRHERKHFSLARLSNRLHINYVGPWKIADVHMVNVCVCKGMHGPIAIRQIHCKSNTLYQNPTKDVVYVSK